MSIKYARSALFSQNQLDEFFKEKLFEKFVGGTITYDDFLLKIRCNIKSNFLNNRFNKELVKHWNVLISDLLVDTDLVISNKKNNDIMKALFSYIYRATLNAEYGNLYGFVSRVNRQVVSSSSNVELKIIRNEYRDWNAQFHINPTICYSNGFMYFFKYENSREEIKRIPLKIDDYNNLIAELKIGNDLPRDKFEKYCRIGLFTKPISYKDIYDLINTNSLDFCIDETVLQQQMNSLNKYLTQEHEYMVKEKEMLKSLVEVAVQKNNGPILLVEFLAHYCTEILNIREARSKNLKKYNENVYEKCEKKEIYFSVRKKENGSIDAVILNNASPFKIFSSRLEAVFNDITEIENNHYHINFYPMHSLLYHTSRINLKNENKSIAINYDVSDAIRVGELFLSVKNGKIVICHDGKEITPMYLSTYNVNNSVILVFLRMISDIQEEFYLPRPEMTYDVQVTYYKEKQFDGIVVQPARWSVPAKLIPMCKSSICNEEFFRYFITLINEYDIPRFVYAYDDNTIDYKRIIDFYNPYSVSQLKKYKEGNEIYFEELSIPPKDELATQYLWQD